MKKLTYEYVKNQIESEGYKLLSKKYKNAHTKLKIQCLKGHQYEIKYNDFQQGHRCPLCFGIRSGEKRYSYDYIKKQFESKSYKLLSKKYKNNNIKLLVECPKGHKYKVVYGSFNRGRRCPICWDIKTHSRTEKDCLNIIKQLTNENIIENDRTQIINPKTNQFLELDIWIPLLKKAIEFNGEYWHNNNYAKYKDKQKVKQCKEKGIDLLTIWFQNWINDRENRIENLKNFLGV